MLTIPLVHFSSQRTPLGGGGDAVGLGLVLVEALAWKGPIQLAPAMAEAWMGFWKRSVLVAL